MPEPTYFIPLRQAIPFLPANILLSPDGESILDSVGLTDFDIIDNINLTTIRLSIAFENELKLALPGLDGFALVLGSDNSSQITVEVDVYPELAIRLVDVPVRLRLQQELLRPVERDSANRWVRSTAPNGDPLPFEISLGGLQFSADSEGGITFDVSLGAGDIDVPAFMIAQSGVVVEVETIAFHFSDANPPLNHPPGTRGVSISHGSIHLPESLSVVLPADVELENLFIGSTGFSGRILGTWNPSLKADRSGFEGSGAGNILDFAFGLKRLALEFRDSALTASEIEGSLLVPYFEEDGDVKINFGSDGDFTVALRSNDEDGLRLEKAELLALNIKSFSISRKETAIVLTGGLEPLLRSSEGLQWPRLDVTDLAIDSTGKFSIKEAWLDLKELATLDLWGFHFELRRIGIGSEQRSDGDRFWVDLSGGLRLIEQIPVALDVEGFRLTWPRLLFDQLGIDGPPTLAEALDIASAIEVQFDGIYLFFGVPEAVEFESLIRFFKTPEMIGFAGDAALRVPASGFAAEAGLLIGLSFAPPFPFLYVYFGVDLPAGIPLGQSGLALKGAQGMLGLNVKPDKSLEQNWYYDWYKRGPIVGAHPTNKWIPEKDALALGVGVTITTADGYVKGTRGLLVLAIPGPILIIEGRALILSGLTPGAEPPLRALAVFDGGAGTVQFNVEAEATLIEDMLEAYGMLEAFFDFNDLTNWHLYLGQDTPRDRRIRASVLKLDDRFLFKADAYLMIDMIGAGTVRSRIGASVGFEPKVPDIGPLNVDFNVKIEGDGLVTARPEQFSGKADLSARIRLSTFGVSVRLSAHAEFLTEGPDPFSVGAEVEVEAEMPSPLDPVKTSVEFFWQSPPTPKIESPLAEIAVDSRFAPSGGSFRSDAETAPHLIYEILASPTDPSVEVIRLPAPDSSGDPELVTFSDEWENLAKQSPEVEADSQPLIGFKQKMNSTIESFARHPDGTTRHYDVGGFHFKPTVTTIKLYEHVKEDPDEWTHDANDWELIGSTDQADRKPLPGVWLAEAEADSPEGPPPRRVQLWTDNPLSSSARALGPVDGQFLGAIRSSLSSADRLLEDYPDLMKCAYTDVNTICVDFQFADEVEIQRGATWEYEDLEFAATSSAAGVRSVGAGARRRTCLFVDGYVDIHFRQRVRTVRIVFCQPSKLPKEAIRVRVSARRGARSQNELDPTGSGVPRNITFADVYGCQVGVQSTLTISAEEWLIESNDDFDCLNIVRMDQFAIKEICYTTAEEIERAERAGEECENNRKPPKPPRTLRPGAYYRLEVFTKLTGKLHPEDLVARSGVIGDMLLIAYNEFVEILTGGGEELDQNYHEVCFFQTNRPPKNLRPYIKWCSPAHQAERFFFGDDLVIRFLRSNLSEMFEKPFEATIEIRDAQRKLVEGYQTRWRQAKSATMFPEESTWEAHRRTLVDWPPRVAPRDDMMIAEVIRRSDKPLLMPKSRYQLEIVCPAMDSKYQPLFSSTFTTSAFKSFTALAKSYSAHAQMIVARNQPSSSSIGELQRSAKLLAQARRNWEHAEVDYRFQLLAGGRKGIEGARLFKRKTNAAHDALFRTLADTLADLYFQPFSSDLELYLLRDPNGKSVIGVWIRSPETLDVRLEVFGPDGQPSAPTDFVGRTEISLLSRDAPGSVNPITTLQTADSTQLLIFPGRGRRWSAGKYGFVLTYHRDYGDEIGTSDHRYDRPIERHRGSIDAEPHSLEWSWQ